MLKYFLLPAICIFVVADSAVADGEFIQFDLSASQATFVVAAQRGPYAFSIVGTGSSGEYDWNFSATHTITTIPFSLRIGPSIRLDNGGGSRGGVRVTAENYRQTPWGNTYWLSEVNSIASTYYFGGQIGLARPRFGLEVSVQGDDEGFRENTIGVNYRFENSPISLRIGHKFLAEESFFGMSVNTF